MLEKLMLWLRDGCRLVSRVWVVVALWTIAICLIIAVLGHGCVACSDYARQGTCYQTFEYDKFYIKRTEFLYVDSAVSASTTAEDAWAQAKRVCGNKD